MAEQFSNPPPWPGDFGFAPPAPVSPTQVFIARQHLRAGASLQEAAAAAEVILSRDLDLALWRHIADPWIGPPADGA